MNGPQAFAAAFAGGHMSFNGTVADVTEEQAKSLPPGVVHPIGELVAHVLHTEDVMINQLQGKPPIWESEAWGSRLGLGMMALHDRETARAYQATPAQLAEYGQKVFANTDAYLAGLTDADLDREVNVIGRPQKVGEVLGGLVLGNTYAHTGEISALKGLHGAKGYPF
ncbi:MAG: DinB family protein [Dehalococcoidia bacterium]